MNVPKIKSFLKVYNKGQFLRYQAEDKGLTQDDIDYMTSRNYVVWVKDDEYRVTQKGSDFAFSND